MKAASVSMTLEREMLCRVLLFKVGGVIAIIKRLELLTFQLYFPFDKSHVSFIW